METKARYVAVGGFVLLVLGALLVFAIWIGGASLDRNVERYLIYFEGSVTGLGTGSLVRYRGVPVGSVTDITIDPQDFERVRVIVELADDVPIVEGNVASLELAGITGGLYIQITGGAQGAPELEATVARYPIIPSTPSSLSQVIDTAPLLLSRASELIEDARGFITPDNQAAFTQAVGNLATVAEALAGPTTGLAAAMERLNATLGNVDGMVAELRVDVARISDRLDDSIATVGEDTAALLEMVRTLTGSVTAAADQAALLLRGVRPGVQEFAETGLFEFTLMVAELRGLAQNLSRVAAELERDPAQFLLGNTGRGIQPER